MVKRIKDILFAPKNGWAEIEEENTPHGKLFFGYVLPLSLVPAIAAFIGYGFIGSLAWRFHSLEWGIRQAVIQFVAIVVGVYLTAFIIDKLANNFGARPNFNKAFSLVAYSYTAACIGGIFYILPSLSGLAGLAGLYGLYILYIGMKPMMKVPDEKNTAYFVVSLITTIVVMVVVSMIMSAILLKGMYGVHGMNRFF